MKHQYRITIDFQSERPLDENCWNRCRAAIDVACSHIVYPKWCGTIAVTSSGMEDLSKEEAKPAMNPRAKDALQRVVRHTMLMWEACEEAGKRLGKTIYASDGETLAALLSDPSLTSNLTEEELRNHFLKENQS